MSFFLLIISFLLLLVVVETVMEKNVNHAIQVITVEKLLILVILIV